MKRSHWLTIVWSVWATLFAALIAYLLFWPR
jgi:hypothetical protein